MSGSDWSKIEEISSTHVDVIHDLAYDFYGKRLATCSSDRYITVWDLEDSQDNKSFWHQTSSWDAHNGSIWRLAWAHPEFGQVIASCGFDGQVLIWEEHEKGKFQKYEICKFQNQPVVDIKFSPRHLGLKLATGWVDGIVRIYEAMDIMNLSQWSLMEEFDFGNIKNKEGPCHIAWNSCPYDPPSLAVGIHDGSIKIYQFQESFRKWDSIDLQDLSKRDGHPDNHSDAIHDISWAPNLGRSFHLIATASKDKTVKIWKLFFEEGKWFGEVVHTAQRSSEAWRVEWNITGTILAASGDDGKVCLYKSDNSSENWAQVSEIAAEDKENKDK